MQHPNFTRRPSCFSWDLGTTELPSDQLCFEDAEQMVGLFQPRLVGNLREYMQINEVTYKDIASGIDKGFLNQRARSAALQPPQFAGFDNNVMNWRVRSSEFERNRLVYLDSILFEQWDEVGQDTTMNLNEKARLLLWGSNIKMHCTCPSFLYWGYQYILTVFDAAIYPETRYPKIRNPQERGIVCKHLNRVLQVMPFFIGEVATEFRNQFGGT